MVQTVIPARKGKSIDEVLEPLTPGKTEKTKRTVIFPANQQSRDYLRSRLLLLMEDDDLEDDWETAWSRHLTPIKAALSSQEINEVLQETLPFQQHKYLDTIGVFITRLIENSYQILGNAEFALDTSAIRSKRNPEGRGYSYHSLGHKLRAHRQRPISIMINGPGGGLLGHSSTNVRYWVTRGVDSQCGAGARRCFFYLEGGASDDLGRESEHCVFMSDKHLNPEGLLYHSKGSCIISRNVETIKQILYVGESVDDLLQGELMKGRSKVYLLEPNGNLKLMRKM